MKVVEAMKRMLFEPGEWEALYEVTVRGGSGLHTHR